MAEHPSRRRRRRLILVLLVAAAVWLVRSRRAATQPAWEDARPLPRPPVRPATPPAPAAEARPAPAAVAPTAGTPTPRPIPRPARAATAVAPDVSQAVDPAVDAPAPGPRSRRAAATIPPGAAVARPDGSAPGPEYTIKAKAGSGLFHGPDSPYFGRTRAEFWFRTAADARAAGLTGWTPRRRTTN